MGSVEQPVSGSSAKRDELIGRHLVVVETIAGTLLRDGQNPAIQKDDLLQVGYLEMIRTIDRQATSALALEKRIARNCRTAMIRFIVEERREQRYAQQSQQKAIRHTTPHFVCRDVVRDAADEFWYPDWSCGSALVYRTARAEVWDEIQRCNLPPELAEIVHGVGYKLKPIPERDWRYYARPVLECVKHSFQR